MCHAGKVGGRPELSALAISLSGIVLVLKDSKGCISRMETHDEGRVMVFQETGGVASRVQQLNPFGSILRDLTGNDDEPTEQHRLSILLSRFMPHTSLNPAATSRAYRTVCKPVFDPVSCAFPSSILSSMLQPTPAAHLSLLSTILRETLCSLDRGHGVLIPPLQEYK